MYCPQCGSAYRNNLSQCPDCHVLLVATLTPGVAAPELVVVFHSSDRFAANAAIGLLEDSGILFWHNIIRYDGRYLPHWDWNPRQPYQCVVPRECAAAAREVLAVLTSPIAEHAAEPTKDIVDSASQEER